MKCTACRNNICEESVWNRHKCLAFERITKCTCVCQTGPKWLNDFLSSSSNDVLSKRTLTFGSVRKIPKYRVEASDSSEKNSEEETETLKQPKVAELVFDVDISALLRHRESANEFNQDASGSSAKQSETVRKAQQTEDHSKLLSDQSQENLKDRIQSCPAGSSLKKTERSFNTEMNYQGTLLNCTLDNKVNYNHVVNNINDSEARNDFWFINTYIVLLIFYVMNWIKDIVIHISSQNNRNQQS